MASLRVYQFLLLAQSAIFILILMYYIEPFGSIPAPYAVYRDSRREGTRIIKAHDVMTIWNEFNIRGPLSNCTIADIMKRPNVVLLTSTNTGFLDMTLNMLESVKKIGLCVYTTIIAEDPTAYRYLRKRAGGDPGVNVVMTNSGETNRNVVPRDDFLSYTRLLKKRQGYILTMLQRGFEVLFTDADTFWFRDPFPYFEGEFDMSMLDPRSPYPTRSSRAHYCAGFAYFKPTSATLQFVEAWIRDMQGKDILDQTAMNNLLRADEPVHVNVQPLDINLFPSGPKFYQLLAEKANYTAVVMHAASIHGHSAKVAKFKRSNMWLINATSAEFIDRQH